MTPSEKSSVTEKERSQPDHSQGKTLLPAANGVAKVMFLVLCICLSTVGVPGCLRPPSTGPCPPLVQHLLHCTGTPLLPFSNLITM